MLLLFAIVAAVAAQPVAVSTCAAHAAQQQLATFNISNPLGAWSKLNAPSLLYQDSSFGLSACGKALCMAPLPGIDQSTLAGAAYALPAHNATPPTGLVRVYELTYNYSQTAIDTDAAVGLGPWSAVGLDFGAPTAAPYMSGVIFGSGTNKTGLGDINSPILIALRFQDLQFCNSLVALQGMVPQCQFLPLASAATTPPDGPTTQSSAVVQWVLAGTSLYVSSIVTPRALAPYTQQQLFNTNLTTGANWTAPTRLLLIGYHTNVTITNLSLNTYTANCTWPTLAPPPTTTTTTRTTTRSTSKVTTRATTKTSAAPMSTTKLTAPAATTSTSTAATTTTSVSATTVPLTSTSVAYSSASLSLASSPASISATTSTSATDTATSLPSPTIATTLSSSLPPTIVTESSVALLTSVGAAKGSSAAENNFIAMVVSICVASIIVVGLVCALIVGRLRRAACWAPIYFGMSPCARTCCWPCRAKPERDLDEAAAMRHLAQADEVRSESVYDRVAVIAPDVAVENYDRVRIPQSAAYDMPSSPIDV
jgi:hypothetical protein